MPMLAWKPLSTTFCINVMKHLNLLGIEFNGLARADINIWLSVVSQLNFQEIYYITI